MFNWPVVQGEGSMLPLTVTGCPLDSTLVLAGTISDGLTGTPILPFTPKWSSAGPPYTHCTLTGAQTAAIPPGGYVVQIGLANGGGSLAYGTMSVLAAPNRTPLFDVLATPGDMLLMVPSIRSDPDRIAALPLALRTATNMVRRFTNRYFTRTDYTEFLAPSLEGQICLKEIPVNEVYRVSHRLKTAITITASAASFQTAYVNFITKDGAYSMPSNLEFIGINLVSAASGVSQTTPLYFSSMTTINDLVTAVNAVSGWTATATTDYGLWPIGEIYGDAISQGALTNRGVQLRVFSEDVSTAHVDRRTGMLSIGISQYSGVGPSWGPAWSAFDFQGLYFGDQTVRVNYNAGFTTVPEAIRSATIEIAKLVGDQLLVDFNLKSEDIGDYSYDLNDTLLTIPYPIAQKLSLYRLHQA